MLYDSRSSGRSKQKRAAALPVAIRERTGLVLCRLGTALRRLYLARLAKAELNLQQHAILWCLKEFGPSCQAEVAVRLGIDNSDLVSMLDRWYGSGKSSLSVLVEPGPDDHDRRRTLLTLTSEGAELLTQVDQDLDRLELDLLQIFDDRERLALQVAAARLLDHGERLWDALSHQSRGPAKSTRTRRRRVLDD